MHYLENNHIVNSCSKMTVIKVAGNSVAIGNRCLKTPRLIVRLPVPPWCQFQARLNGEDCVRITCSVLSEHLIVKDSIHMCYKAQEK